MKRSLLACCAFLGCGGAAATDVTMYGLVDLNLGVTDRLAPAAGATLRVNAGGMNTSRLGFLGSEDLGGGMKAVFQLELGVAPDTGVADTPLFKRQATVGLEGRHGGVLVGRAFTSVYDFMLPYDPMGYAPAYSWAPTGHAGGASKYGMALAFDNLVKVSARAGDVSFGASWGAGEAAGGDKGAVAANYAHGPFAVVAAWERIGGADVPIGPRDVTTASHVGALYRHGPFKFQAAMRDYRQRGSAGIAPARARVYWAGINWLATPVLTVTAALYRQDILETVHDADPVMAVARLRYALSRRTDLYATAAYAKARDANVVALARDEPGFGSLQRSVLIGMQHRF